MDWRHSGTCVLLLMACIRAAACSEGDAQGHRGDTETGTGQTDGDSDGDTDEDTDSDSFFLPVISDFQIEGNPNSAISFFATWNTDVPSTSAVEFGADGEFEFRISDNNVVSEHRVLVYGCHGETEYTVLALSSLGDDQETVSEALVHTTGQLPWWIPEFPIGEYAADQVQPGWTLMNVHIAGAPPTVVMYDFEGKPVWYYTIHGMDISNIGIDVSLVDGKNVLMSSPAKPLPPREVDLAGEIIWEGPPQPVESEGQWVMHHDFGKLENGNYLFLRKQIVDEILGDFIEEITPELETIWTWSAFDWISHAGEPAGKDWTHGNSVSADLLKDVVYFSARSMSSVFKIDRSDGSVIWRLGAGGDFSPDPDSLFPWTVLQHEPEVQPSGNVLVFDNGDVDRAWSRVVEFELDEDAMTSEIVWEFPGEFEVDDWYTSNWFSSRLGDADRLPNGNTLVTAGDQSTPETFPRRVFEVTEGGQVVWELLLYHENPDVGDKSVVYRSERIPVLLEGI